jgi:hypothetical protein
MPDLSKYDLDFRPKTYWDLRDVLTQIEAKVTGKVRKDLIKKALQDGESVPDELLKGSLKKNLRKYLGSIHPSFMGGEYLPELEEADVIIASINLKSTTHDVIVVIARLTDKGMEYRVEDEYMDMYSEGKDHFHIKTKFSNEPLSFKELIDLIDNAEDGGGLVAAHRIFHYDDGCPAEEYYDFATAESGFYPQLKSWYDDVNEEWLEEKKEEERQKELEEEREYQEREKEQEKILKERSKIDQIEADKLNITVEEYTRTFHKKVGKLITDSEWDGKVASGMWGNIGRNARIDAIREYILDYFYTNTKFPSGKWKLKSRVLSTIMEFDIFFKFKD